MGNCFLGKLLLIFSALLTEKNVKCSNTHIIAYCIKNCKIMHKQIKLQTQVNNDSCNKYTNYLIKQHTPLYIVYGIPRCIPQNKIWGFVFGICNAKLPIKENI